MHYLALAAASFVSVFILGFQSRNINTRQYKWAAVCSVIIGLSNTYVWRSIAQSGQGVAEVLIYSVVGGFAIVTAMWVHDRFVSKDRANG